MPNSLFLFDAGGLDDLGPLLVLVNPANASSTESTLREAQAAGPATLIPTYAELRAASDSRPRARVICCRRSAWPLSPFPFAGRPVVVSDAALDHFVPPVIARYHEGGEVAAAEAKRVPPVVGGPEQGRPVNGRASKARHDRSHLYAGESGNFLIRKIVHLAQHDGFAERLGQLSH